MVRIALAFTLVALFTSMVSAQELITIRGRVGSVDNERAHYDLMIVNKRTRTGTFGNADGSFVVQALRTDTLMIGSSGYRTAIITMTDSAAKPSYEVYVRLMRVVRQLPELQVINERTLAERSKGDLQVGLP
ncbi:MAG: hypothetical protein IPG92_18355 [Flavobacteriales bacterium]|nr:hypothetical protein [Flavobacteriales bacterium]